MAEKPRIVGIDLGTTNTCVASVRNRIPKVVPTDRGNLILPSVVALSPKGDLLVGGVAKDQMVVNPTQHHLRRQAADRPPVRLRIVQDMKGYFTYEIVEGPKGEAAVNAGRHDVPAAADLRFVLAHAKRIAEQFLGGAVEQAVISVPAYYNDNQRKAVKEAGWLAGFNVKRIVNEPTAAALAYGFNRGLDQNILVYDLGGGTFDVSVLQVNGNVFEVLATGGDTFLGGVDFDNRIIDYVLAAFQRETKVDLSQSPIAMQRIKNAAEAAKIDLTLIPNVVIELPYIEERKGQARRPARSAQARAAERSDRLTWSTGPSPSATGCSRRRASTARHRRGHPGRRAEPDAARAARDWAALRQARPQGRAPRRVRGAGRGAARRLAGHHRRRHAARRALDAHRLRAAQRPVPQNHRQELHHPADHQLSPAGPKEHSPTIELDIFQGDSEFIVDNEYLGTVKVPASAAGRRIDFRLNEECLLEVVVDLDAGPRHVALATRDTPDTLKRALADERQRRMAVAAVAAEEPRAGLMSGLRRIFGRN